MLAMGVGRVAWVAFAFQRVLAVRFGCKQQNVWLKVLLNTDVGR